MPGTSGTCVGIREDRGVGGLDVGVAVCGSMFWMVDSDLAKGGAFWVPGFGFGAVAEIRGSRPRESRVTAAATPARQIPPATSAIQIRAGEAGALADGLKGAAGAEDLACGNCFPVRRSWPQFTQMTAAGSKAFWHVGQARWVEGEAFSWSSDGARVGTERTCPQAAHLPRFPASSSLTLNCLPHVQVTTIAITLLPTIPPNKSLSAMDRG